MRALLLAALVCASSANAKDNGDMIQDCLAVNGYDKTASVEQRLNNFDWGRAGACVSGFEAEKHKEKLSQIRQTLDQKPWYKGPNWRWELRSEYECSKAYTDHGPITLCSKPHYLQGEG